MFTFDVIKRAHLHAILLTVNYGLFAQSGISYRGK